MPQDEDALACLAAAAHDLFPPQVAVAVVDPRLPQPPLFPQEEFAVARATERRRHEFAGGRAAARRAMVILGLSGAPVPMGEDRAPIWPAGVTGALSHCETACLAAVARLGEILALGIDVELDLPLEEALWEHILTPDELDWLAAQPAEAQPHLARLIFSAKECAYKAQYPLTRALYGFMEMRVELDISQDAWRAVFLRKVGPFERSAHIRGGFRRAAGTLLTAAAVTRRPDVSLDFRSVAEESVP